GSGARVPLDGDWHELTLDVGHASNPGGAGGDFWNGTQVVGFGIEFNTGANFGQMTSGTVVFQVDSFSLEQVIPPDGGVPDGPPDVAPDGPSPDMASDRAPTDVPTPDGGLAKDQFLTAYTNARCSYQARCGLFTSVDACLASTSPAQYNQGLHYE